jgi:hypothetical protein
MKLETFPHFTKFFCLCMSLNLVGTGWHIVFAPLCCLVWRMCPKLVLFNSSFKLSYQIHNVSIPMSFTTAYLFFTLPSTQSYNNTMLPDTTFYLSYVLYTASHSTVSCAAIFRIFNTFITKSHLHNISYCPSFFCPLYSHHMLQSET